MSTHTQVDGSGPVIPLWINGEPVKSTPETKFGVSSFKGGNHVAFAQSANADAARKAADAALVAFSSWKRQSAKLRRDLLLRVAEKYAQRTEQFIEMQVLETSCTEKFARFNVQYAIDTIKEIASRITSISGEIPAVGNPDDLALVFKQPVGPMLTIAPWNASVILATRAIVGQIAAGCTVVLKASELSPQTHHYIRQAFEDAGLPKGVLNVIQTSREDAAATTEALIAHPAIRKIEFIGSRTIGNIIGQMAAKYTKPVLMELGGKSPAIVLDDARLEQAAHLCLLGLSLHHGQLCFSTERILVQKPIADKFAEILKSQAPSFNAGHAVNSRIKEHADAKVMNASRQGAKVLVGGPGSSNDASCLRPTILTGVTRDMAIFDEETFGPSASLYTFDDDEEAIQLANASEYGLNASIHTTNMERGIAMARELEVAQVHINNLTGYDEPTFPIGGEKASGWGRSNASWSLNEYLTLKTISINMKEMHTWV